MASLYRAQCQDGKTMTVELALEIANKLQALLEDTLLKNMTLKVFEVVMFGIVHLLRNLIGSLLAMAVKQWCQRVVFILRSMDLLVK